MSPAVCSAWQAAVSGLGAWAWAALGSGNTLHGAPAGSVGVPWAPALLASSGQWEALTGRKRDRLGYMSVTSLPSEALECLLLLEKSNGSSNVGDPQVPEGGANRGFIC